ncbi:hypothetical protein [Acinetobacter pittii]|uniref:hypothetical protein n=1 Tax=Acinetobacter pittii TaxID=48296 RepID=UPI0032612457
MFPILNSLPSIHASFVGILAAFVSAFFIFSFQKIVEAEKKLEDSILNLNYHLSSFSCSLVLPFTLLDNNYKLDWEEKCKPLIREINSLSSRYKNYENILSLTNEEQEHVISKIKALNELFYLFTHHPQFYNSNKVSITESVPNKQQYAFDELEFLNFKQRVFYLYHEWEIHKDSYIILIKLYDELQRNKNHGLFNETIENALTETKEIYGNNDELLRNVVNHISKNFQKHNNHLNYLIEFFDIIRFCQEKAIPEINELNNEIIKFKEKLNIKSITIYGIYIATFITITGIILPLFILEVISKIPEEKNNYIISLISYFIFTLSFSPYFLLSLFYIRKIKNSKL